MPKPLEDEKIEEILDLWAEHGDIDTVVEEADVVETTVRKYLKRAAKDGDDRVDPETANWLPDPPDKTAAETPGESPFATGLGDEPVKDYSGMTPGDFLKDFFDDFEVGVKPQWVALQAKRADRRNKVPSKEAFISDLLNMKSGIAQSAYREATYIADEYWAEAQVYLGQTGRDISDSPISGQMVNPQAHQNQPPPGTYSNEPGWVGPGQMQPTPPQAGQQDSVVQLLIQQNQQMMREFREALQTQNQQDHSPSVVEAEVQKMMELKNLVDDLQGEGAEQISEVLSQHFTSLEQRLASQGQAPAPAAGESLEEKLISLAATSDNVSLQDVMQVLEERGSMENDPEVIKARYEKEMKEAELKHETDRYEHLGSVFQEGLSKVGEGFARELVSGEGGEAAEAGREETDQEATADGGAASTSRRPPPEPAPEPCPRCGADTVQGATGTHCPSCEWGMAQCDLCQSPVEIPPVGDAEYGRCPECGEVHERGSRGDLAVDCPTCDWAGETGDLVDELLQCDSCGQYRPIVRAGDADPALSVSAGD